MRLTSPRFEPFPTMEISPATSPFIEPSVVEIIQKWAGRDLNQSYAGAIPRNFPSFFCFEGPACMLLL